MNLNDPFNRHSKQQQKEYIAFCSSIKGTIKSEQDADALLKNMQKRSQFFTLLIVITDLVIVLLVPEVKYILIVFSAVILLWMWTTILKGKGFIRRYIAEELSNEP